MGWLCAQSNELYRAGLLHRPACLCGGGRPQTTVHMYQEVLGRQLSTGHCGRTRSQIINGRTGHARRSAFGTRLVLGSYLAVHGAQKLFGAFGGPGLAAAGTGFELPLTNLAAAAALAAAGRAGSAWDRRFPGWPTAAAAAAPGRSSG
jgi:hypothetical protein